MRDLFSPYPHMTGGGRLSCAGVIGYLNYFYLRVKCLYEDCDVQHVYSTITVEIG